MLWEPANKPSTAALACQSLGWMPHMDQKSCGAPREGEQPAGLCCWKGFRLPSLCGLPRHSTGSVLLLGGFFFLLPLQKSSISTRVVQLLARPASHRDVWLLQHHYKVRGQQEGTSGPQHPCKSSVGLVGVTTHRGRDTATRPLVFIKHIKKCLNSSKFS